MTSTIRSTLLGLGGALLLCLWSARSAEARQTPAPPQGSETPSADLAVTTHLDRTAVWVGDRFHYRIFVDHPPSVQFVLENLNAETINLDPLRVVDVTHFTTPLKNGNQRLSVDLTLANLTAGVQMIQIPQVTLFYFRRGGAAALTTGGEAAAEGLTIPGPAIAVRSTLPPGSSELRDAVTVTRWPRTRWIVAGVGWSALILLIGGLVWEGARMIRAPRRKGPDPAKVMAAVRARWQEGVPVDFDDVARVDDFYARSYRDVKAYLSSLLNTHTEGLTADEIRFEMTQRGADSELIERTAQVFEVCETARYARTGTDLTGNRARALEDDVRYIFQRARL